MVNIALCDDEEIYINDFYQRLTSISISEDIEINITTFSSPADLVSIIDSGKRFDIIFLDIMTNDMTGMEAAQKIRRIDNKSLLIFVTSYVDFMQQGYEVKAFRYLLKNQVEESFERITRDAISELNSRRIFTFEYSREQHSIHVEDILYFESDRRVIRIHTYSGEYCFYDKLSEVEKAVGRGFIRIHRSYLINAAAVSSFRKSEIILSDGTRLPVSVSKSADVKRKLMLHYTDGGTNKCII